MHAKQYEATLPAGYDMQIIRDRVTAGAALLDDRAGLGLKAYMIRERGADGPPVNQYAPFYLWNDTGPMAEFLFGGTGFERIIRSFGRLTVRHWMGVACVAGGGRDGAPRAASRRLSAVPLDPDADDTGLGLSRWVDGEVAALDALAARPDVHTAALALDPRDWQLLTFVLWADACPPEHDATERYEVLHVSSPGLGGLLQGRCW